MNYFISHFVFIDKQLNKNSGNRKENKMCNVRTNFKEIVNLTPLDICFNSCVTHDDWWQLIGKMYERV